MPLRCRGRAVGSSVCRQHPKRQLFTIKIIQCFLFQPIHPAVRGVEDRQVIARRGHDDHAALPGQPRQHLTVAARRHRLRIAEARAAAGAVRLQLCQRPLKIVDPQRGVALRRRRVVDENMLMDLAPAKRLRRKVAADRADPFWFQTALLLLGCNCKLPMQPDSGPFRPAGHIFRFQPCLRAYPNARKRPFDWYFVMLLCHDISRATDAGPCRPGVPEPWPRAGQKSCALFPLLTRPVRAMREF